MGDEQDHSGPQTPLEPCTQAELDEWEAIKYTKTGRILSMWMDRALKAEKALDARCSDETAHNVRDATIKEIARYLDEEGHGIPAEKVRFMGPAVTRPHQPGEA